MATFSTTNLVDNRVLVRGNDDLGNSGSTVLDGEQWADLNSHAEYSQAEADFNAAVEAFFAPITEATEALQKSLEKPTDSLGYVVLQEATEGQAPQEQVLVKLTRDSQILRLIESGEASRLIWVDGDLEILAAPVAVIAGDIEDEDDTES